MNSTNHSNRLMVLKSTTPKTISSFCRAKLAEKCLYFLE